LTLWKKEKKILGIKVGSKKGEDVTYEPRELTVNEHDLILKNLLKSLQKVVILSLP